MNAPFRPPRATVTPHKITLEEARRMWDSGVFPDYPDFELIEGKLYEMPADGVVTRSWNAAVNRWLVLSLGREFVIMPDKTLPVTEHNGPKPDFYVYPASLDLAKVTGANVSLVIEISDSTLEYDRDDKGPLYAKGGVRDYWILDCQKRKLLVFRPNDEGMFGEPQIFDADQTAEAILIPGLALKLNDLDLPKYTAP